MRTLHNLWQLFTANMSMKKTNPLTFVIEKFSRQREVFILLLLLYNRFKEGIIFLLLLLLQEDKGEVLFVTHPPVSESS